MKERQSQPQAYLHQQIKLFPLIHVPWWIYFSRNFRTLNIWEKGKTLFGFRRITVEVFVSILLSSAHLCDLVKNPPAMGETPWRRECLPTPTIWPGEFHEQRSLSGYSPCGYKESDTTEWLSLSWEIESRYPDKNDYQKKKKMIIRCTNI